MTTTECDEAAGLIARAQVHAARAAKHTRMQAGEGRLRRIAREWAARRSAKTAYRCMVKVHKIGVDNTEGAPHERHLRPGVQRTRELMDEARRNIGTRDENDDWYTTMCLCENGAALVDDIDEDLEIGSVAAFGARFDRRHARRNPPAPARIGQ